MTFDCVKCGACCRLVGVAYPSLDRGDGVCKHLTPSNLCAIYEERPDECRVAEACPPPLTQQEWFRRNGEACERLHLAVYGSPLVR